jgi:hypothetical protein
MARNKFVGDTGYRPVWAPALPDDATKPPGPKSGTRPRVHDSLAPRIFLAVFRSFRDWKLWLIFFVAFQIAVTPAFAQVSKEYQLKAVFLWRLAQFTQWPSNAFENNDSPIAICVLGENPFGDALDEAVRGETAHGRKFVVQHFRSVQEIKTCHILYISLSVARQVKEIIAALRSRSILTVSDIEGFTRSYDGMVRFLTEQNKINLRINLKAATAARLVLDPRLLRAAEVVGNE